MNLLVDKLYKLIYFLLFLGEPLILIFVHL
jgi:hypothetical protein